MSRPRLRDAVRAIVLDPDERVLLVRFELPERVADPWLRALTEAALGASIPVLLGGHTLVGPGIRLVVGPARRSGAAWT